MPTYTYRCQKCGEEFERFQSMSDEPVKRCPSCKGKVQRTFHPVGIVLKGSGFHKTDYRSPAKKPPGETGEKSDKSDQTEKKADTPDGSSSTKSEGKEASDG